MVTQTEQWLGRGDHSPVNAYVLVWATTAGLLNPCISLPLESTDGLCKPVSDQESGNCFSYLKREEIFQVYEVSDGA